MKVNCSFYIGHQSYLAEVPLLTESESKQKLCKEISEIVYQNIEKEQFEIYQAKNKTELSALLRMDDEVFEAFGFSTETTVADDEDGLPVLFYVNAHFEIPETEDFDGEVDATLNAGNHSLTFDGLAEIDDE